MGANSSQSGDQISCENEIWRKSLCEPRFFFFFFDSLWSCQSSAPKEIHTGTANFNANVQRATYHSRLIIPGWTFVQTTTVQ